MKLKFSLLMFVLIMSASLLFGTTIYDIQYTTTAGADGTYPSLLEGQTVTVTGIVTAFGYYSSGNSNRFFISDVSGGAWNGIFVFNYDYTVAEGDEVEVTGEVQEYFGFTELGAITDVTVLSSGNPVPDAIPVLTGDLMAPSTGEQYEGCLIKISDVTTMQGPSQYGEWYVDDGSGNCQIDDAIYTYENPSVGETFTSITGAVDYSYDEYGVNARSANDFVTGGVTPPTLVSANATSATSVTVVFSKSLDEITAETISNYSISPSLAISEALLQNNSQVVLTTADQTEGLAYTITVNNIEDTDGNPIEPNSTTGFIGYIPGGSGDQIFFSEYIEGSSNNKALEIYNGTGSIINLSNYRIAQAVNGNGWQYWHEFPDDSTLDPGDVWVITTDAASTELQAVADEILSYPSVAHHNGDDARGLEKTTDNGKTWTLIDVIGVPDEDPGDGWDVAGTPSATKDHTLVRKSSIDEGSINWTSSAGTNADNSEWIVYPIDTFEYLGEHGENDTTPPTLLSAVANTSTSVEVTFSEQVDQTTAQTYTNYAINDLTVTDAILQSGGMTVELITGEQEVGYAYTITVNNIEDLAGNVIDSGSTINFTGYEEGPTTGQLIFSEYIEGSSNNKALELYNASSQTIYLDNYRIAQTANGNDWQYWHYFPTDATLSPKDVWVIAADEASQTILNVTDEAVAYPSVAHFTGNDARGIEMTTDGGATWTLIDVIGVPTEDPGTGWDVAGVTAATQNHTLVRKTAIETGNTDWTASAGTNEDDSEWIVYPIDTFDYIGTHGGGVGGNVVLSNLDPTPGEAVTVTLTYAEQLVDPILHWGTILQNPFSEIPMSPAKDYSWFAEIPGQTAGVIVFFYIAATDTAGNPILFPDGAPDDVLEYDYALDDFQAILEVPHYTFSPLLGETFQIQYSAREGDKVVLRLYNSEGVLVNTFTNEFSSGTKTIEWNGKDDNWNTLPPGLYICHLEVINPDNGDIKHAKAPIVISAPLK